MENVAGAMSDKVVVLSGGLSCLGISNRDQDIHMVWIGCVFG